MTAIIVIPQKDAVYVLTDGAAYSGDGKLALQMQKAHPLLHLNAVVAGRGLPLFAGVFALHAGTKAASFDHLKSLACEIASGTAKELRLVIEASAVGGAVELAIAGWSERHGPSNYFLGNHDGNALPKSWELIEGGTEINFAPSSDAIKAELAEAFPNGLLADRADPVVDGLRILEIQRKHPVEHGPTGCGPWGLSLNSQRSRPSKSP